MDHGVAPMQTTYFKTCWL